MLQFAFKFSFPKSREKFPLLATLVSGQITADRAKSQQNLLILAVIAHLVKQAPPPSISFLAVSSSSPLSNATSLHCPLPLWSASVQSNTPILITPFLRN